MSDVASKYRINHEYAGGDPWTFSVEKLVGGEWLVVATFNEMSDDYAHTNARDLVKKLVAGEEQYHAIKAPPVLPGVPIE